jgi:hypothetical protein
MNAFAYPHILVICFKAACHWSQRLTAMANITISCIVAQRLLYERLQLKKICDVKNILDTKHC